MFARVALVVFLSCPFAPFLSCSDTPSTCASGNMRPVCVSLLCTAKPRHVLFSHPPFCLGIFALTASQVHWFSIVNSLLIVLFLTAMIAMILIRNLHRDIMRYNRVPTDEEKAEEREETGWKVRRYACGGGLGTGLADSIPDYLCYAWSCGVERCTWWWRMVRACSKP